MIPEDAINPDDNPIPESVGIDAWAPLREGAYADGVVTVRPDPAADLFRVWPDPASNPRGIVIGHGLSLPQVDDGLAQLVHDELFATGRVSGGQDMFERIFTGVVRTCHDDALTAWRGFYANTLARLDRPEPGTPGRPGLAAYAPVYARAEKLTCGDSVVELGCCFGFLSLTLARKGLRVTASDVNPGTLRLLDAVASASGTELTTLCADAAALTLPDDSADTVVAIHLLEHLSPEHGRRVVAEAIRLARRRVVIAVPYESEPEPAYGHVRTFDHETLTALGRACADAYGLADGGMAYEVSDHHGGWLVLERA